MKIQLNKWYFDFTQDSEVGYYYIMSLHVGRWNIGASGIYHFSAQQEIKSFRLSTTCTESMHQLRTSHASMHMRPDQSVLNIRHKDALLSGKWSALTPPLKRVYKPLLKDETGWCDWKVWSPISAVDLSLAAAGQKKELHGKGYIDFVRFAFPFWKMPLRSLYWSRLHSDDSWMVLFRAENRDGILSLYYDPHTIRQDVHLVLEKDPSNRIKSFCWSLGNDPGIIKLVPIRCLEDQEILNRGSIFEYFPGKLLQRISSFGTDKKYVVRARIKDTDYTGIMEEVLWHEQ
jgi:hypothetical protein